jgi:hypothetical protein
MESIPIYEDLSVLNQRLNEGIAESEIVFQNALTNHEKDIGWDEMVSQRYTLEDIWEDISSLGCYIHPAEPYSKSATSKANRYTMDYTCYKDGDTSDQNTISHYRETYFGKSSTSNGYQPFEFYERIIGTNFDDRTTSKYDNFLSMISGHAPNRENFTRFLAASLESPEIKEVLAASVKKATINTMIELLQTMKEEHEPIQFPQAPYEPLSHLFRDAFRPN